MKDVKSLIVKNDDEIIQTFKESISIYNRDISSSSDIKYETMC